MAEDGDKDSGHRRLRPVCPGRLRGTLTGLFDRSFYLKAGNKSHGPKKEVERERQREAQSHLRSGGPD